MIGINTNVSALNSARNLYGSQSSLATSLQRLSSGLRVNSAKDDAAGLAIAERMNSQVRGMKVAIRNANDGISMAQTAESAMGQVGEMLQRMRELTVQASNATNQGGDRDSLQKEFLQLQNEITRVSQSTSFNGSKILVGTGTQTFQVGANAGTSDQIDVAGLNLMSSGAAVASAVNVATGALVINSTVTLAASFDAVISQLDAAITMVNDKRADLGAVQNRFTSTIASLQASVENQSAARGRIMDADFASETANMSRAQILQQAGTAMLSQANQSPQQVLSLLR